ncbi:MAG: family transcriptional regulator, cyclic receptor protein [Thermoleophilaceae bacterium]|jgi:CRP/FNR family transcriptional regulator|nr:family transcriptional regulator, cyclic receptor protein [Thermoleophilaceae bacterium]
MSNVLSLEQKTELLDGLAWLSSLAANDRVDLAREAEEVSWDGGVAVFREGDVGHECFLLHSGSVRVHRRGADGREISLATLHPGTTFGELALFDGEVRSASIETMEPSAALRIGGDRVMQVVSASPQVALELVVELAGRLRAANDRLFDHALSSETGRIAAALLSQVQARQATGAAEFDVEVAGSPSDVAKLAGAPKDEVQRLLYWLENEGTLTIKRGRIVVHTPADLASFLG